MSAILNAEPKPIDSKIPTPLRWTIARCLEKDAGAGYESTRDLYHDLRGQQEHLSDVFTSTEAPAPDVAVAHRSWWPKAAVAAIALALATARSGGLSSALTTSAATASLPWKCRGRIRASRCGLPMVKPSLTTPRLPECAKCSSGISIHRFRFSSPMEVPLRGP